MRFFFCICIMIAVRRRRVLVLRAVTSRSSKPARTKNSRRRGRPPRAHTEAAAAAFPGERVIRRYGNRRFYDLRESRAITLEQIAGLVRADESVRILDAEHGNEDITRRILVQILAEPRHRDRLDLLPVTLLRKLIALRDEAQLRRLSDHLAAGLLFLERQLHAPPPLAKEMRESFDALMSYFLRAAPEGFTPAG